MYAFIMHCSYTPIYLSLSKQELDGSFRRKIIPRLASLWQSPSDTLLGLPRQEWERFLQNHRQEIAEAARAGKQEGTSFTDIISYLEAPTASV